MPTLATTVDGLKLPNPFVIGSGPPGTNGNVIGKAFDEGWGAVICKTISLDASNSLLLKGSREAHGGQCAARWGEGAQSCDDQDDTLPMHCAR